MFFSISKSPKNNFDTYYNVGGFHIYVDQGWKLSTVGDFTVFYKGYADIGSLEILLPTIVHQQEPKLLGNFCAIVYDRNSETLKIKTDLYRSFPIYVGELEITNLEPQSYTVWSDSLVTVNEDLSIAEDKFDLIKDIDLSELTEDQVVDCIDQILNRRTIEFLKHNKLPIRAHLSGGVDSLLVYSYLQKHTNQFELVKCQHIDYDYFWLMNSGTIKQHYWGYSQIHHWNEPCVLTSGAPGDECMLRSPTTSDLWLKFHGIRVTELLELAEWQNCLHYSYFKLPKNYKIFQEQTIDPQLDRDSLAWNLCNIIANDWQHWHLGNTLTWTPLRDLEIFKLLLRLPLSSQLGQIMDSVISYRLIEKNEPRLTKLISDQKNTDNQMSNLAKFILK
jgi:hypothetical protein